MPTSRLALRLKSRPLSASDRAVGPILAAQPQVRAIAVRVFFLNQGMEGLQKEMSADGARGSRSPMEGFPPPCCGHAR